MSLVSIVFVMCSGPHNANCVHILTWQVLNLKQNVSVRVRE